MFFGFHYLDIIVICVYVIGMVYIGVWYSRKGMKNREDFYLGGRRMGKAYQFFLNFGNATNADQAVTLAREVYRQGVSGMWIQFVVIFLTPFYWFVSFFHRRMRVTTLGDFLTDRFSSKSLGAVFATQAIIGTLLTTTLCYVITGKTLVAMTPKPETSYTVEEKASIDGYKQYRELSAQRDINGLSDEESALYSSLHEKYKKGELNSYVSYFKGEDFWWIYGAIVFAYTVLGGLMAATITDIFQGLLIVLFSLLLIPIGLLKVGGFSGLHERVQPDMFHLFSANVTSEYTWFMVASMVFANLVGCIGSTNNMAVSSAARTDFDARFGMVTGNFMKRFMMIAWALCGIIAVAYFGNSISDPDIIWGVMIREFLPVGPIGLMFVGILAANMSSQSVWSLTCSAMFVNNLYRPGIRDKSEAHYILVGRIVVAGILFGSILLASSVTNIINIVKFFFSFAALFGASIWLSLFWRGLTRAAVYWQIGLCLLVIVVLPYGLPSFSFANSNPTLLVETAQRTITVNAVATAADFEAGLASQQGQKITKQKTVDPVGIYFERVVQVNPDDPASPKMGVGRFNAEHFILSRLGVDFSNYSKASIDTVRFLFDSLFPFLLLFVFSRFTRKEPESLLNGFFARMHTPAIADREKETADLEANKADPARYAHRKLLPNSNWEFPKPTKVDVFGFFAVWVAIGVIFLVLYGVMNITVP